MSTNFITFILVFTMKLLTHTVSKAVSKSYPSSTNITYCLLTSSRQFRKRYYVKWTTKFIHCFSIIKGISEFVTKKLFNI